MALDWEGHRARVLVHLCYQPMRDFGLALPFSRAQLCDGAGRELEGIPEIPSSSDNLSLCDLRSVNLLSLTRDADKQVNEMNIQDLLPEVLKFEVNNRFYYFKGKIFPHLNRFSRSE